MPQQKPLEGRVAIVTGASRGIGRAVALALGRSGARVAVNYLRRTEAAREVEAELRSLGAAALTWPADVADPGQVQAMIAEVARRLGPPGILVNNAGISSYGLLTDLPETEWDRLMAVHLKGAFNCCKAVLPGMLSRRQGRIINVSSIWGLTGAACEVAYSAAKSGIIGFTRALAREVGPAGVTVNAVAPGAVSTEMLANLTADEVDALAREIPLGRLGRPEEIAEAVAFLASPQAGYITGQVWSPNGGLVM